jgi:hypothetical protein
MKHYKVVTETLEDGVKQYCLIDTDNPTEVIARYGKRKEAVEVLVRYQTAMDRMEGL